MVLRPQNFTDPTQANVLPATCVSVASTKSDPDEGRMKPGKLPAPPKAPPFKAPWSYGNMPPEGS